MPQRTNPGTTIWRDGRHNNQTPPSGRSATPTRTEPGDGRFDRGSRTGDRGGGDRDETRWDPRDGRHDGRSRDGDWRRDWRRGDDGRPFGDWRHRHHHHDCRFVFFGSLYYPFYWDPWWYGPAYYTRYYAAPYYDGPGYSYAPVSADYGTGYSSAYPQPSYSYGELGRMWGEELRRQAVSWDQFVQYLQSYIVNASPVQQDEFRDGFLEAYGPTAAATFADAWDQANRAADASSTKPGQPAE